MINFRYHIVSLMAVFLALAVGIAAGVSLGPSVNEGVVQQADQDRKQVTELRAELDRRNTIDQYRQAYELQTGRVVTENLLSGARVAVVAMPDAPNSVVQAVTVAVAESGGTVVRDVRVNEKVFDPSQADEVTKVLAAEPVLELNDGMSAATKFGTALARAVLSPTAEERDPVAIAVDKTLRGGGLANIDGESTSSAQLAIVVAAVAPDPKPAVDQTGAHLEMDLVLKDRGGVVIAGPNSTGLDGTDVLAARSNALALDKVSTVDVADLSSGVTTTILAGKEQLLGRQGAHYGALAKADAVVPPLPVR